MLNRLGVPKTFWRRSRRALVGCGAWLSPYERPLPTYVTLKNFVVLDQMVSERNYGDLPEKN